VESECACVDMRLSLRLCLSFCVHEYMYVPIHTLVRLCVMNGYIYMLARAAHVNVPACVYMHSCVCVYILQFGVNTCDYRVAKMHRMPYDYRSIYAKEPCN